MSDPLQESATESLSRWLPESLRKRTTTLLLLLAAMSPTYLLLRTGLKVFLPPADDLVGDILAWSTTLNVCLALVASHNQRQVERLARRLSAREPSLVDLAIYDDIVVDKLLFVMHLQGETGPQPKVRHIFAAGGKPRCPACRAPIDSEGRLVAGVEPGKAWHCAGCGVDYAADVGWHALLNRARNLAAGRFLKANRGAQILT